jgi:hypothetical protein
MIVRTAARADGAAGRRRFVERAGADVGPTSGRLGEFIGGIVAWGSRAGRGPGGTSFVSVAFLIGWLAVRECGGSRVRFGPNPLGFHPPSLRAGRRLGRRLALYFVPRLPAAAPGHAISALLAVRVAHGGTVGPMASGASPRTSGGGPLASVLARAFCWRTHARRTQLAVIRCAARCVRIGSWN